MALPREIPVYTYADYLNWDEDERAELIEGAIVMQAAPSTEHQLISGEIFAQLHAALAGKRCRVFTAPFAVRLFEKHGDDPEKVNTVVEPDLCVVCDPEKLDKRGCAGAPDLVIEILSPSSIQRDYRTKLTLYLRAGVKEYWIVDPESRGVQTFLLDHGYYKLAPPYENHDIIECAVLPGCTVQLESVFPDGEM